MAGDWLKIEKATVRKPEVLRIAIALGIHPDHAFGICFRFWSWCDDQLETGNVTGVTESLVDALVERSGFASALVDVGWLQVRNGSLVVPNFDRHLSESAKKRGLTAKRVAKSKSKHANAAVTVDALPREEKRRVEVSNDTSRGTRIFSKPTVEEVSAYCLERRNGVDAVAFWNHYESNGWMVGKNKMKDWMASVRTWERNSKKPASRVPTPEEMASWTPTGGADER